MADLPTNFRTFLLSRTAIANVTGLNIHQGKVPENRIAPYVWFARSGTAGTDLLNPDVGTEPITQVFAMECVSEDIDEAQALADAMRAFNYYRGAFGDITVQGVFVEDQSDDYEYRTIFGDEGFHSAAFSIEVHSN